MDEYFLYLSWSDYVCFCIFLYQKALFRLTFLNKISLSILQINVRLIATTFFCFYAFFLIFVICKHWLVCDISLCSPIFVLIGEIVAIKRTFCYNGYRFIFNIRSLYVKEKTQTKSIISI